MNKGVYIALLSIGLAQGLKIPIHYVKKGELRPDLFFQTGGMPSSHSAGVSSLTTFIALKRGVPTVDFALSLVYGLIVMYDAQGIRRQTGELTLKVNSLGELVDKIHKDETVKFEEEGPKKLKEMLGHQPAEVLGGALLGVLTGTLGYLLTKKKK
ncbi:divergent PAP2 family protein [Cytobacillus firmus]|uniref:Acid phosphatase/vanadium-dependent haloperoxidase n=3 Tax=Bacillales TaxID=1385 RepID=W7L999_CYTFI|nr:MULTISPECIES: divergent PAP2 family protein [Bacillales]EWG08379.1 acid phosphatase/vanadium-dependent haloperoxidase [Cytobacillus firmus DS1]KAF0826035.1 putative membrane protein YuiD [Cytobacillus firmus]MBG9448917.1 acid phosphatase [Cytobacillus firmus]MBG9542987.1 acid phosphatase [Cytobacillus firmus]MBG9546581.1 acid phosphatase [Cytobacillus firmus]